MPVRKDPKTNRWYFRTTVKLPNGTKTRISGTPGKTGPYHDLSNTKVGAQEAERRAIAELLKPTASVVAVPEAKEVPTVAEYSKVFMESYFAEQKPSERRGKLQILRANILPAFGEMRLDEIQQVDVDRFKASAMKNGIHKKTINNRLAVLSTLLKYAAANEVIAKPTLKFTIKVHKRKIEAVSSEDVNRLLASCQDQRYRVAILLAAEAGLRAGEIRGLQWGDVGKDGLLNVNRALDKVTSEVIAPKSGKARVVPITERLQAALEALPKRGLWVVCKDDGGLLLYNMILKTFNALYKQADVAKPSKPIHCLRHTYGTECAAAGVPLSLLKELMGHSDIKTTLMYVHPTEDQMRSEIARVFNRGSAVAETTIDQTRKAKSPLTS